MYRVQDTIFSPTVPTGRAVADNYRDEADLIVTLCTLGFVKGRLAVGHPVDFSWDPKSPEDQKPTTDTTAQIRAAVGGSGDTVRCTAAPAWAEGALITGAAGSASVPFASRHATPTSESAAELQKIAAKDTNVGYRGYGAYTGFVDTPDARRGAGTGTGTVMSTMRFNVPADGPGERWRPTSYSYGPQGPNQANAAWGLVNKGQPIEGMQAQIAVAGGVVGYTHGMVQAIYRAVSTGPWCTPFEIAVGQVTTKVASCMACTLFMYAAGFPPSAIHLGRGDSWIPFYPVGPGAPGYSMSVDEGVRSTNLRWALECWQHLQLGLGLAQDQAFLQPAHAGRLQALQTYLSAHGQDPFAAANLFLDALTVADSFTTRIARAMK